jgi:3-hydroxyacyl-CoA dehydrogenase/enoyl-CoA hydratase/3-hydroxybutyryl-CoA epimerase
MAMNNIRVEIRQDGIGIATLDMPGRPFNVFSEDMMADFDRLIEIAATELTGLVICSGKPAFVAGADLAMIKDFANMRFDADWQTMRDRFSYLGKLFRRLEKTPVPVVAAINGLALGGGLELAMACHARVCVDVASPILGLPEIILSLLPGAGGTQRLPRYVGLEKGLDMLLGGAPVTPAEALHLGLVDAVVSVDELLAKAIELVKATPASARWDSADWDLPDSDKALLSRADWREWCLQSTGWNEQLHQLYPAVEAIIACVEGGGALPIDEACDIEWDVFVDLMSHPVAANMVLTCFLNKTAASKWAAGDIAKEAPSLTTVAWCSEQQMPTRLAKKVKLVNELEAELLVVDGQQTCQKACVRLINAADTVAVGADEERSAQIFYSGDFNRAEVVEVIAPAEISRAVVELVAAMDKTPLWSITPGGGMNFMLTALRDYVASSDKTPAELAMAAKAVDAEALLQLVTPSVQAAEQPATAADKVTGLDMLGKVAIAALQSNIGRFEALDVLAVFGLCWPKWTGGPIAYLAMLQRKELPADGLSLALVAALASLEQPLKIKACYADEIELFRIGWKESDRSSNVTNDWTKRDF